MNSIHRLGMTIAAMVALLTIAGAVLIQGLTSGGVAQANAPEQPTSDPTATDSPSLDPVVVYINPVPTPQVITVIHTPRPARRARATPKIVVVPGTGGDGGEGGD
jgi:hypothetical protein